MRLRLITASSAEPLSVAEAAVQVGVVGPAHDALLAGLIAAARLHLDGRDGLLGRALMTQTWELLLDAFPGGDLVLPLPPLQSVESIAYVDPQGATQTLAASVYGVDAVATPGVVHLNPGQAWPATRAQRNAVTVRFVAGYGAATDVPSPLRTAMLMHVADLFEHRERQGAELFQNAAYDELVFPYRMLSL